MVSAHLLAFFITSEIFLSLNLFVPRPSLRFTIERNFKSKIIFMASCITARNSTNAYQKL